MFGNSSDAMRHSKAKVAGNARPRKTRNFNGATNQRRFARWMVQGVDGPVDVRGFIHAGAERGVCMGRGWKVPRISQVDARKDLEALEMFIEPVAKRGVGG